MNNYTTSNMTRIYFTFLCALAVSALSALSAKAQDYRSSIRKWSDGPLTSQDFRIREVLGPDEKDASWLYYGIKGHPEKKRYGNLVYRKMSTEAYMDKVNSWVKSGYDSDQTVAFQQVCFDMVELTRRKFQSELDTSSNGNYNALLDYYMNLCDNSLKEFKAVSQNGRDTSVVNRYRSNVEKALDEYAPKDTVPEIRLRRVGFGYYIGYGGEFYTGEITDYLKSLNGMSLGCEVSVSKARFGIDMAMGGYGRLKRDVPYPEGKHDWKSGERTSGWNINLTAGYALVDKNHFNLIPFVGIGAGMICRGYDYLGDDVRSENLSGLRFCGGVQWDWKIRRYYSNNTNSFFGRDYGETGVRFRLYAARTGYESPCSAWSVNLGVAFNIYGRFAK